MRGLLSAYWLDHAHGWAAGLAPLALASHERDGTWFKTKLTIPPLLTHVKLEPGRARVFTPGLYLNRDDAARTLSIWTGPVVWHDTPGMRFATVFPLLWRWENKVEGARVWAGLPLWWSYRGPRDDVDLLLPLYWHHSDRSAGTDTHGVATACVHRAPGRWAAGLAPLAFLSHARSGEWKKAAPTGRSASGAKHGRRSIAAEPFL